MGVLKTDLLWYVIPTMLVLFSLLAFLDSKNGKLYVSRLVALAVVLISIGLLYLEPFYFAAADVDTVIITTDGANKEDSLRLKYPNNKFIEWSDTINASDLKNHVVINGYGFPEYDLYKLEGKKVDFIPADKPSGIIDVNYNSIANVGENRAVQLKVNDLKDSWIKLSMLGDVVDSVQVATDSMELVALNFTPLIAGKSLLKLIVENNTSISQEEQLPVVVQEPDKSAVLMLNDQPTFESRFLKNHLIEQGHKVFVRSKITTERFRYENSGFEFDKLPYLSDHVLSEFDLLVIPATIISNLSRTERLSIEKKIRESGLGLLVLVSSASDKIPSWLDFSVQALEDEKYQLELSNKRIAVESIGNISSKNVLSECHLAANEVCLKVTQPLGQGKVGVLSIVNSFKLSLNGNDLEYQLLWDEILSTLIYQPTNKLTIDHQFVYIDEPMKLQVRGNGLPEVLIDSTRLTFRQHEFVSDRWQATIWPNRKGWNSIELENEQINWLYIFGPNDWIPMTNYHTLVVNQSYFDSKNNYSATQKNSRKMISKWWFLLLFLLSMGYLWLEPKLR